MNRESRSQHGGIAHDPHDEASERLAAIVASLHEGDGLDMQERLALSSEGIELAQMLGRDELLAEVYRRRSDLHFRLSDYFASQTDAIESARLFEATGNSVGRAAALLKLGGASIQLGEYDRAEVHLQETLRLMREREEPYWESLALTHLGILHMQIGEYDLAMSYYLQGLAIQERLEDTGNIGTTLVNLGLIALESGDYISALDHFNRSLAIFREMGDLYGMATSLKNAGDTYAALGDLDKALKGNLSCLEIAIESGERYQQAGALDGIGKIYLELGDHQRALDHHLRSLEIKEEIGDRQGAVETILSLGILHLRDGRMDEAFEQLLRALAIAEEIGARPLLYRAHLALGEAFEQSGDIARALDHYKKFYRVKSDVAAEEASNKLRQLQARLELERLEKEAEVNRLKAERMEHELLLARKVQLNLLPKSPPAIDGIDIASICVPALEAGGDYYDFFPLDDGRLGVAIGDVTGKGMPAAIYMTLVKGIMTSHATASDSPKDVLARTNRLVYQTFSRGSFVSMIYAVIDPVARAITYARAGHNPLLLLRGDSMVSQRTHGGMALGLAGSGIFSEAITEITVALEAGDRIVLYTDGFSEAMNAEREDYGDHRLLSVALRHGSGTTARALLDAITDDVRGFAGDALQHDDMTMIVLRLD